MSEKHNPKDPDRPESAEPGRVREKQSDARVGALREESGVDPGGGYRGDVKPETLNQKMRGNLSQFQRQRIDTSKLPEPVLYKWSAAALEEGFVPFPKKLVRCMHRIFAGDNSAKELAVVLAVADFKRPNLTRPPSLSYLAFLAGLDEAEFDAILRHLESKGFVHVDRHPDGVDVSLQGLLDEIQHQTD
jgi:hypothetical protein